MVVKVKDTLQSPLSLKCDRSRVSIPHLLPSPYHRATPCLIFSYWVGGEGIFARPRFPIPIFPPPPNFVFRFAKCAAKRKDVVLTPPSRARTTDLLPLLS